MIVMGDTGDNGRGPDVEEIAQLLKENMVLPLAIHFEHESTISPLRGGTKWQFESRLREEQKAMQAYKNHLGKVNKLVYGASKPVPSVNKEELRQRLQPALEKIINQVTEASLKMTDARLGIDSIQEIICEQEFQGKPWLEQRCKQQATRTQFLKWLEKRHTNISSTEHLDDDLFGFGIPAAKLKLLLESDEELATVVMENPKIGFTDGYMAVREQGQAITRPILLLSSKEIKRIQSALADIIQHNSDCSTEENAKLLKEAMATILGDILQINIHTVSIEQAHEWFELTVDSKKTALGTVELVKSLCSVEDLWISFLNRLKMAKANIQKILLREDEHHAKRSYQDLNNYLYFWVYPEELLPPVQ